MRAAKSLVAMGEIELMSTMTLPTRPAGPPSCFVKPAATPCSPNSTFSTSGVSGSIRNTMSARSATARALAQGVALEAAMASGSLLRVWTKSV